MTTHVARLPVFRPLHLMRTLQGPFNGLIDWYKRQRAIGELRALPDHLLQDIGLQRESITEAVDGLMNSRRTAGN